MTVTRFEFSYLCLEPFLLPLYRQVRRRVRALALALPQRPLLLDVGGRKSHYTIGTPADVTIIDLPRQNEVQYQLNLGLLPEHLEVIRTRRSNLRRILLEDMTRTTLPSASFDLAVSVEVLEHVEEDRLFIQQVARVLKPGGVFLMTTPNGDYVNNTNPDHKRHYTREQLYNLLISEFPEVEINYAVRDSRFQGYGLQSWSVKKPLRTILSMVGNFLNYLESAPAAVKSQAHGTHHLVALARKSE